MSADGGTEKGTEKLGGQSSPRAVVLFGRKKGAQETEMHIEEFNDLCSSPNVIRVIKSRRVRWVGHVARIGERWSAYRVFVGET